MRGMAASQISFREMDEWMLATESTSREWKESNHTASFC